MRNAEEGDSSETTLSNNVSPSQHQIFPVIFFNSFSSFLLCDAITVLFCYKFVGPDALSQIIMVVLC